MLHREPNLNSTDCSRLVFCLFLFFCFVFSWYEFAKKSKEAKCATLAQNLPNKNFAYFQQLRDLLSTITTEWNDVSELRQNEVGMQYHL